MAEVCSIILVHSCVCVMARKKEINTPNLSRLLSGTLARILTTFFTAGKVFSWLELEKNLDSTQLIVLVFTLAIYQHEMSKSGYPGHPAASSVTTGLKDHCQFSEAGMRVGASYVQLMLWPRNNLQLVLMAQSWQALCFCSFWPWNGCCRLPCYHSCFLPQDC